MRNEYYSSLFYLIKMKNRRRKQKTSAKSLSSILNVLSQSCMYVCMHLSITYITLLVYATMVYNVLSKLICMQAREFHYAWIDLSSMLQYYINIDSNQIGVFWMRFPFFFLFGQYIRHKRVADNTSCVSTISFLPHKHFL